MKKIVLSLLICILTTVAFAQTWQYGSPFDTNAPASIFRHVQNKVPLTFMYDSLKFPYPTNAWFKNLYWGKTVGTDKPDSMVGCNPVFTYPYAVGFGSIPQPGWTEYGNAKKRLGFGYRPYMISVVSSGVPGNNNVTYSPAFDGYFGVLNENAKPDSLDLNPFILSYDDLSVTVRWREKGFTDHYMEAPLVKGMPYVTMKYSNMVPYFASQARPLIAISVDDHTFTLLPNPDPLTFTGKKFILKLAGDGGDGKYIYWVLYSSSPVTVKAYYFYHNTNSLSAYQCALLFTAPFNGTVRAAYLCAKDSPGGTFPDYNDSTNVAAKLTLLDKYSKYYPVGGTFSASIHPGSDTVQMTYSWQSNIPGNDSLLTLALPHHMDILSPGTPKDTVLNQYKAIYGTMTGIFGKTWNMKDGLIPYDWQSNLHNLTVSTTKPYRDELLEVLKGDVDTICGAKAFKASYCNQVNPSTYFGGKELAKRGRLAIIADELGIWYDTKALASEIRDTLKRQLNRWMDANGNVTPTNAWTRDTLMYETRYGGMINSWDYHFPGADFQNSLYTDHHFHYGYFLYAAAALAKNDTAWGNTYKNRILLLARDFANPSASDHYFTRERMTDWYDMHSWAQGLDEAGALGNNQESTSEAVNAWYGMYLLGIALNNDNLKNTGRLHLACEVRAARKYWQIGANSPYPAAYTNNYKVIGNLYESSVNSVVAFGSPGDPRMVYGIQQIPTTPVNNYLLNNTWCDSIYQFYYKTSDMLNNPNTSDADINLQWGGINLSSIAIAKPGTAYNYWHTYLKSYKFYSSDSTRNILNYDDGQSKTNVLYNALVNGPTDLMPGKINFQVTVKVISNDTLGLCKGSIRDSIPNLSAGIAPIYYYLFGPDGSIQVTPDPAGMINNLCAGTYTLEVIDQEFNEGSAEFTINYPDAVNEVSGNVLRVYPNPSADGQFRISWNRSGKQPVSVSVMNMLGSEVYSSSLLPSDSNVLIHLKNAGSGLYYLTVRFDDGSRAMAKVVMGK
ncbi:MAG: glycosyl hydrolase [Bacteroidota bacterium]|nr:glycosyl hydrolase [Bacteroidota bacterium]